MSPNLIDGLIFLTFIAVLLLATHIAAVVIEHRNKQDLAAQTKLNSLEGEK